MHDSDRIDPDLAAHIQIFIDELPNRLGLERIMNLECEDPAETLELIREIHSVVQDARRKALALFVLAQGPTSDRLVC